MKFHETFMENVNFVGREIESLQEVVKGMAAGMDFADEEGAGFTSDVEEEDDNYREPTEQEVFDRIKEAFEDDNKKVYMGWFLDYDYQITLRRHTTLQSNFQVGQYVYIMHENKIKELYVQQVILVSGYAHDKTSKPDDRGISVTAEDAIKRRNVVGVTKRYVNKEQNLLLLATKETWNYQTPIGVAEGFAYHTFGIYPTNKVFTSKEELVEHLMEED